VFPNGTYYEGGFLNCKPSGEGKWVFKDGNVVTGRFKQEKAEVGEDEDEQEEEQEGDEVILPIF
jgi:hypothetical protein